MKKFLLILCGIAIILTIVIFVLYKNNQSSKEEVVEIFKEESPKEENNQSTELKEENSEDRIYIDIKGEVVKPGLYEVDRNMRVGEAIELAGGLLPSADTSLINLAKIVEDEMTIIVYSSDEVKEKYLEKLCQCQDAEIANDALVNIEESQNNKNDSININSASEKELESLDGIGEAKAKVIIEYREKNGNFSSIDDIRNVPGIGDALFEKIKAYITV